MLFEDFFNSRIVEDQNLGLRACYNWIIWTNYLEMKFLSRKTLWIIFGKEKFRINVENSFTAIKNELNPKVG